MTNAKILIVDPDATWTLTLSELLMEERGVFSANSAATGLLLLESNTVSVVIADINAPDIGGLSFVEKLRQIYPQAAVIVYTAHSTVAQAVEAIRLGALDYIEKSRDTADLESLREKVARALSERQTLIKSSAIDPRHRGMLADAEKGFYGIISRDPRMRDVFELIQTIANSTANVLVQGDTGTGKELVARAIHEASGRHGKPFITLDCSALTRELLESELFGHEKGSFTGANDRHIGRFERANGGTLFLDEVANISLEVQAKLLRVLQTRTFERVGGQKTISVDVRIVAASNRPLEKCVTDGIFREDLYHRLNVVQIDLPALRERVEDVPLLAMEFVKRFARQNGKSIRGFSEAAMQALSSYNWPGNVRELENVVHQAVVLAKSPLLEVADLPKRVAGGEIVPASTTALSSQLGEPEKQIVINALRQNDGNIKRTAEMLDISRTTLYAKLKKYQIDPEAIR